MYPKHLRVRVPDQILRDELANIRPVDVAVLRAPHQPVEVGIAESSRAEHTGVALQNAAVPRMRALRAGEVQTELSHGDRLIELACVAKHERVVALSENLQD